MSKYRIILDGKIYEIEIELLSENETLRIQKELKTVDETDNHPLGHVIESYDQKAKDSNMGLIRAPMPGTVIRIFKEEGETVKKGETVLVLEAMKMENEIPAPTEGTVRKMNCKEGETVTGGEVLFEIGK